MTNLHSKVFPNVKYQFQAFCVYQIFVILRLKCKQNLDPFELPHTFWFWRYLTKDPTWLRFQATNRPSTYLSLVLKSCLNPSLEPLNQYLAMRVKFLILGNEGNLWSNRVFKLTTNWWVQLDSYCTISPLPMFNTNIQFSTN